MITKDIFYSNLLRLTGEFTLNSNSFNTFFTSLQNPGREEQLITLSERLGAIRNALQQSYDNNLLHESFDDISAWITEFGNLFADFPNSRLAEIELIVALLIKIESEVADGFDVQVEVDTSIFCINLLPNALAEKHFFYFDPLDLKASFALVNLLDMTSLKRFISNQAISVELFIHLLSKIGTEGAPLGLRQYALIKTEVDNKASLIKSAISLHILRSGK